MNYQLKSVASPSLFLILSYAICCFNIEFRTICSSCVLKHSTAHKHANGIRCEYKCARLFIWRQWAREHLTNLAHWQCSIHFTYVGIRQCAVAYACICVLSCVCLCACVRCHRRNLFFLTLRSASLRERGTLFHLCRAIHRTASVQYVYACVRVHEGKYGVNVWKKDIERRLRWTCCPRHVSVHPCLRVYVAMY